MCPCPVDKGFLRFRQLLFAFLHDAVIRVYVKQSIPRSVHRRAAAHLPNR